MIYLAKEKVPTIEDLAEKVMKAKELFKDLASNEKELNELASTFICSLSAPTDKEWRRGRKLRITDEFLEKLYRLFMESLEEDLDKFYDYILSLPERYINVFSINVFEFGDPEDIGAIGLEILMWKRRKNEYLLTSKIIIIDLVAEAVQVYELAKLKEFSENLK